MKTNNEFRRSYQAWISLILLQIIFINFSINFLKIHWLNLTII